MVVVAAKTVVAADNFALVSAAGLTVVVVVAMTATMFVAAAPVFVVSITAALPGAVDDDMVLLWVVFVFVAVCGGRWVAVKD